MKLWWLAAYDVAGTGLHSCIVLNVSMLLTKLKAVIPAG